MKSRIAVLILGLTFGQTAWSDAVLPTEDIEGAADTEMIGRFEGSFILDYKNADFDEISIPTTPLEAVKGEKDDKNNHVFRPAESIDLEGSRTRLVYVMPAGVSPLQVLRNYQQKAEQSGARTLFECKGDQCGGSVNRSSGGGGGSQSLSMYLWSADRVSAANFSTANCAQTSRIKDQRYTAMELPNGTGYLSVLAYNMQGSTYCNALKDYTVAVVDVMAREDMGDSMVVVEPEEMAAAIRDTGSVALYGIYFDTGNAAIKPESNETLDNIAALLGNDPSLNLLVVGHTDNQGEYELNRNLSEQRAAAVTDALVTGRGVDASRLRPVGVAFAAPVAPNATENGRALNRRVELVAR